MKNNVRFKLIKPIDKNIYKIYFNLIAAVRKLFPISLPTSLYNQENNQSTIKVN